MRRSFVALCIRATSYMATSFRAPGVSVPILATWFSSATKWLIGGPPNQRLKLAAPLVHSRIPFVIMLVRRCSLGAFR
jgi:hypothetical protein